MHSIWITMVNICRKTKEFLYSSLSTSLRIFALLVSSSIKHKTYYNPLNESIYKIKQYKNVNHHLLPGEYSI